MPEYTEMDLESAISQTECCVGTVGTVCTVGTKQCFVVVVVICLFCFVFNLGTSL